MHYVPLVPVMMACMSPADRSFRVLIYLIQTSTHTQSTEIHHPSCVISAIQDIQDRGLRRYTYTLYALRTQRVNFLDSRMNGQGLLAWRVQIRSKYAANLNPPWLRGWLEYYSVLCTLFIFRIEYNRKIDRYLPAMPCHVLSKWIDDWSRW